MFLEILFSFTVPPITSAEEIIIRFLIMYCPSRVSPNGNSVKQTSGKSIRGRKVPGIWINNNKIENLINGL